MPGVLLTFGSMAFGALVTYFVSRHYNVAAAVDLGAATSHPERELKLQGFSVVVVKVNGRSVEGDVPAIKFYGWTMVPLRLVGEALVRR